MARKVRVEYEGAIYHLMNRGDRREAIFRDDEDRQLFLKTLGETCRKTGWQVHAWCLMANHFHLVVETPRANLVAGMGWFLGTYTGRFNRRHKLCGHLFSGRYKSLVVDQSGNGYLKTVCDYVHLNPVRAKLLARGEKLATYRWSSYGHYLQKPSGRPGWLRVDRLLGECGIPKDSPSGRREFAKQMEARCWERFPEEWKKIRRGWYLGDKKFRKELLEHARERMGEYHSGEERTESEMEKAERIVEEELGRMKWEEAELARRKKGDVKKVRLARRLRAETTMTLKWIAQRLKMGTWTHVANRLHHVKK
jgi:putative transposase